jgi:hypothetical protein
VTYMHGYLRQLKCFLFIVTRASMGGDVGGKSDRGPPAIKL